MAIKQWQTEIEAVRRYFRAYAVSSQQLKISGLLLIINDTNGYDSIAILQLSGNPRKFDNSRGITRPRHVDRPIAVAFKIFKTRCANAFKSRRLID